MHTSLLKVCAEMSRVAPSTFALFSSSPLSLSLGIPRTTHRRLTPYTTIPIIQQPQHDEHSTRPLWNMELVTVLPVGVGTLRRSAATSRTRKRQQQQQAKEAKKSYRSDPPQLDQQSSANGLTFTVASRGLIGSASNLCVHLHRMTTVPGRDALLGDTPSSPPQPSSAPPSIGAMSSVHQLRWMGMLHGPDESIIGIGTDGQQVGAVTTGGIVYFWFLESAEGAVAADATGQSPAAAVNGTAPFSQQHRSGGGEGFVGHATYEARRFQPINFRGQRKGQAQDGAAGIASSGTAAIPSVYENPAALFGTCLEEPEGGSEDGESAFMAMSFCMSTANVGVALIGGVLSYEPVVYVVFSELSRQAPPAGAPSSFGRIVSTVTTLRRFSLPAAVEFESVCCIAEPCRRHPASFVVGTTAGCIAFVNTHTLTVEQHGDLRPVVTPCLEQLGANGADSDDEYTSFPYCVSGLTFDPLASDSSALLLVAFAHGCLVLVNAEGLPGSIHVIRTFQDDRAFGRPAIVGVAWDTQEPGSFVTCDGRSKIVTRWHAAAPGVVNRTALLAAGEDRGADAGRRATKRSTSDAATATWPVFVTSVISSGGAISAGSGPERAGSGGRSTPGVPCTGVFTRSDGSLVVSVLSSLLPVASTAPGHAESVFDTSFAVNPSTCERIVATGSFDETVRLFSLDSLSTTHTIAVRTACYSVHLSACGSLLAVGLRSGEVAVYEFVAPATNGAEDSVASSFARRVSWQRWRRNNHKDLTWRVQLLPWPVADVSSHITATATAPSQPQPPPPPLGHRTVLSLTASSAIVASSSRDGTLQIVAAADGTVLASLVFPEKAAPFGVAASPLPTSDELLRRYGPTGDGCAARWTLAVSCQDATVRVFDLGRLFAGRHPNLFGQRTGSDTSFTTPLHVLSHGHDQSVFHLAFNPFVPGWLLSAANDAACCLWRNVGNMTPACSRYVVPTLDSQEPGIFGKLFGHTDKVRSVAWSFTMAHVCYSGSWDCTVRVWNAKKLHCLYVVAGHASDVYGVATHPLAPGLVVTSSRDGTSRVWSSGSEATALLGAAAICARSIRDTISGSGRGAIHRQQYLFDTLATFVSPTLDHAMERAARTGYPAMMASDCWLARLVTAFVSRNGKAPPSDVDNARLSVDALAWLILRAADGGPFGPELWGALQTELQQLARRAAPNTSGIGWTAAGENNASDASSKTEASKRGDLLTVVSSALTVVPTRTMLLGGKGLMDQAVFLSPPQDVVAEVAAEAASRIYSLRRTVSAYSGSSIRQARIEGAIDSLVVAGRTVEACDLLVEVGEYDRALSLAPRVSLEHWRQVSLAAGRHLLSKPDVWQDAGRLDRCAQLFISGGQPDVAARIALANGDTRRALVYVLTCATCNRGDGFTSLNTTDVNRGRLPLDTPSTHDLHAEQPLVRWGQPSSSSAADHLVSAIYDAEAAKSLVFHGHAAAFRATSALLNAGKADLAVTVAAVCCHPAVAVVASQLSENRVSPHVLDHVALIALYRCLSCSPVHCAHLAAGYCSLAQAPVPLDTLHLHTLEARAQAASSPLTSSSSTSVTVTAATASAQSRRMAPSRDDDPAVAAPPPPQSSLGHQPAASSDVIPFSFMDGLLPPNVVLSFSGDRATMIATVLSAYRRGLMVTGGFDALTDAAQEVADAGASAHRQHLDRITLAETHLIACGGGLSDFVLPPAATLEGLCHVEMHDLSGMWAGITTGHFVAFVARFQLLRDAVVRDARSPYDGSVRDLSSGGTNVVVTSPADLVTAAWRARDAELVAFIAQIASRCQYVHATVLDAWSRLFGMLLSSRAVDPRTLSGIVATSLTDADRTAFRSAGYGAGLLAMALAASSWLMEVQPATTVAAALAALSRVVFAWDRLANDCDVAAAACLLPATADMTQRLRVPYVSPVRVAATWLHRRCAAASSATAPAESSLHSSLFQPPTAESVPFHLSSLAPPSSFSESGRQSEKGVLSLFGPGMLCDDASTRLDRIDALLRFSSSRWLLVDTTGGVPAFCQALNPF